MATATVLIVDDVSALAEQYAYDLRRVGGFETLEAVGGRAALETLASEPVDCVILDLEMPDVDGFSVLRELRKLEIETPVIVYTGTGDYARCVQAVKLGAYSFIDKSEPMEQVAHEVARAIEHTRLSTELATLRADTGGRSTLIGSSEAMRILKDHIARVGAVPSAVLVQGESGTGKELVARELHRALVGEADKPFVAVNCAALPDNLVESELFGHERGAFTGAAKLHRGAFERAAGGTIFLDEIGDMPQPVQAKLLRVLEQKELTRIGGEKSVKVSARVVAATNRDLGALAEKGEFRSDLYYRLNVHTIAVPPLRERRSDIPELVEGFLVETCRRFGVRRKRMTPDAQDALMAFEWHRNNVRELRNVVERMVIATDDQLIGIDDVPADVLGDDTVGPERESATFRSLKADAERQIVVSALERNDWHITNTAAELGLADHASLLKIMRRHGVVGKRMKDEG